MDDHEPASFSLTGSLRRVGDSGLSTLRNRVELFALEVQEEKHWLITTLLWAGAAMFFTALAIVFVAVTVVWLSPEAARPWVLGGFCVLFIALAVSAISGLRGIMRDKPPAFSETVSELKKDAQWIRSPD